ncbi:MAG: hypothetical protein KDE15_10040 [Erythrobacter sp.]|nr:hypothetical protein [Erythrobacter sp.]
MSRSPALFFALALCGALPGALCSHAASAQQAYGPAAPASEEEDDGPVPLVEAQPCDEDIREDGAIVVCRELPDSQRYMSPLPKPVESDRPVIPGLTDPPCWVENPSGGICIRFGSVPEYPILVDLTQYPEPLSEEDASHVSVAPEDEQPHYPPVTGRRVAIDLSED